jgi:hypothetical protein
MYKTSAIILALSSLLLATNALATDASAPAPAPAAAPAGKPPREIMRQKMEERLMEIDTNKDGVISKVEFMTQAEDRFKRMDKNSDGKIDKSERDAMHEQMDQRREHLGSIKEAKPTEKAAQ